MLSQDRDIIKMKFYQYITGVNALKFKFTLTQEDLERIDNLIKDYQDGLVTSANRDNSFPDNIYYYELRFLNYQHKYNVGLFKFEEKAAFLIKMVDPDLQMLKLYQKYLDEPNYETLIREQMGWYDSSLKFLERKYALAYNLIDNKDKKLILK